MYTSQVGMGGMEEDSASLHEERGRVKEEERGGRGISMDGRVSNERERVGSQGKQTEKTQ